MDGGLDLKQAIKKVLEEKVLGTWRLAIMPLDKPQSIFFAKNSGPLWIAQNNNSVIVSSNKQVF